MIRILLIIAAITSLPLLSTAAEVAKPNIVLVFVDDLGYGDLGCYGGKDIPTPNIDRLAARGVRFTDGYVTAPVCGPSRVGLLTGAYQQRFGCYWNEDLWLKYGLRLPVGHKLLPQALKAGGYVTGHIGKWNITPEAKPYVDEAYDVMNWKGAYFPDATGGYLGVDGPDFRVEQHGWGPQRPEDLSGWSKEWPEETLLGSAGPLTGHKAQLQEGGIREPFILYWPGHLDAGRIYSRPVSTLDLYPTFCAVAGTAIPNATELDGVNLLPYVKGEAKGDPHEALFWKTHNASAVRQGDMKLVIEPWGKRRLFDLSNDLGETHDLSAENPDIVNRLHRALTNWADPLPPAVSGRDKPNRK